MNHLSASIIAICLYLTSTVLLMLRCRSQAALQGINKNVLLIPGVLGLLVHSAVLYSEMLSPIGINLGFYTSLSVVCAFITLFTLASTSRYPAEVMCMIMMPVSSAAIAVDMTYTSSHMLAPGSSEALITHVLTSLVAYSVLGLAALHAVVLSVQNSFLHNRQPTGILNILPPLVTMEKLLFESISIGFVLLSVSLVTGLMFLENMFAQQLVHKTILSIVAWFVFGILLYGRVVFGWRGKTAIRWTLGGFISLMLAYFGSKFVLEIILS